MTELLYQTDSYLREFEAVVTSVDVAARTVTLNRTAFYPGGGGQPCDTGDLEVGGRRYAVVRVERGNLHVLDGDTMPEAGAAAIGCLDWERRFKLMRTHTAMHILCGVVWRDYGASVTGGNMELLEGRMDFEFERLQKDFVQEIEDKINVEVRAARDVRVRILPRGEAFQIPDLIRTKINLLPEGILEVRTVEIVGLDLQADGGTHVNNTRAVGRIRITDYKSKGGINKRIYVRIEDDDQP
ncbi:MAG: alanyl-tRNA editing protein [Anaerolineae bacterium]|nr:alanyl-tRNA editing protein [Anaerolineae bacterium]NUQ02337.1 alanyl-tRNA editing protein [Anaerolineae bacterium]